MSQSRGFMKKISAIILFLSFIAASGVYAKNKAPVWLVDLNKAYPSSEFIAQVGEGTSKQDAELDAIARISNYFESNIDTTTIGRLQMADKGGEITKKSDFERETKVSSNVKLFTLQYSDSYKDKKSKKYFIVAYINRDEAYKVFRPKLSLPADHFDSLYKEAKSAEKKGDYLQAVKFLKKARLYGPEFEEQYSFALLINSKKLNEFKDTHNQICEIDAYIIKLLQKCSLNISVENDSNGLIAAKAQNLFSDFGFPVNSSAGKYSVNIKINLNEKSMPKGTSFYPQLNISMSDGEETIFSFGEECEKVSAVNADVAQKRAYAQIEKLLEQVFTQEFNFE